MAVGTFITPLINDWTKPADWIDISNVGDNEINFLVTDSSIFGFYIGVSSGTYNIDWGDGTIDTGRNSGTLYEHAFAEGAGTPTSYGYNTVKIRVYTNGGNITTFTGYRPQTPAKIINNSYNSPLLWAVFGTNSITSLFNAFGTSGNYFPSLLQSVTLPSNLTNLTGAGLNNTFLNCTALKSIVGLNSPWGNITTLQNTFGGCTSIERLDLPPTFPNTITTMTSAFSSCFSLKTINFPSVLPTGLTGTALSSLFNGCYSLNSPINITSWPNAITSMDSMFANCYALTNVTLPTYFPTSLTTTASMFSNCRSLLNITLPTAWSPVQTTTSNMFVSCYGLIKVILPTTGSNTLVTNTSMFQSCTNIRYIENTSVLGSPISATTMSNIMISGAGGWVTGSLSFGARLSQIVVAGGGVNSMTQISGIRLTNTGSLYAGTSPQINISYCSLETGSLVDVFNDLPTLASKTINITGCSGAATLTAGQRAIATGKGWTITG